MRNCRNILVAFGLALSLTVVSAEAAPITGAFSISGNFFPVNGGALSALSAATGIDFGAALSPGSAGAFSVNSANGDFSFLAGTSGLIRDFSFAGAGSTNFPVPSSGTPILAFQTFAAAPTLAFALESIGATFQNGTFLLLSGQGTFNMSGFSSTPGTFDFSGNGAGGTFSFSASNGAVPQVPEPASLVLLGAGLLVCAASLSRRRRRTS